MAKKKAARRFSDEAVKAKTGKVWAAWFKILDAAGAKKMKHMEIARHLYEKHKMPGWWSQMVANEYEQAHGLRETHQTCDGDFATGVSRTLAAPLSKVYNAWANDKARRSWLKGDRMEITTATKNISIRAKWDKTTRVSIMFYGKGTGKSRVVVDHMKLENAAESHRVKKFWAHAIDRMEKALS